MAIDIIKKKRLNRIEEIKIEAHIKSGLELYDDFEIESTEKLYKEFYNILTELNQGQIEDVNNFLRILNRYNELIAYRDLIEIIPSLNNEGNAYEKLITLLIECLNKKNGDKTIGDILISNALEVGRILTSSELIYDSYKQYQKVGLNKTARITSGGDLLGLTYTDDYSVSMNVYTGYQRNVINRNNPEKARNISVGYLWVLRHEFRHVKQFRQLYESGVDDELNRKLWELDLYLHTISPSLYAWYHDSFPLEFDADIHGYKELINDLWQDYKNEKTDKIVKDISIKMKNRKDNYSFQTIDELLNQLLAMNYLVSLPLSQREDLVNRINEIGVLMQQKEIEVQR